MSATSQSGAPSIASLTASFSALLICIPSLLPANLLSDQQTTTFTIIAGILSPYLAAYALKLYHKIDTNPDLVAYISRLESDLNRHEKLLNTEDLSDETKSELRQQRDTLILKIAKANQDWQSENIAISGTSRNDN